MKLLKFSQDRLSKEIARDPEGKIFTNEKIRELREKGYLRDPERWLSRERENALNRIKNNGYRFQRVTPDHEYYNHALQGGGYATIPHEKLVLGVDPHNEIAKQQSEILSNANDRHLLNHLDTTSVIHETSEAVHERMISKKLGTPMAYEIRGYMHRNGVPVGNHMSLGVLADEIELQQRLLKNNYPHRDLVRHAIQIRKDTGEYDYIKNILGKDPMTSKITVQDKQKLHNYYNPSSVDLMHSRMAVAYPLNTHELAEKIKNAKTMEEYTAANNEMIQSTPHINSTVYQHNVALTPTPTSHPIPQEYKFNANQFNELNKQYGQETQALINSNSSKSGLKDVLKRISSKLRV